MFYSAFVFLSVPCIVKEVLLGYELVKCLSLLAVVCVSGPFGAVCANGNPRDFGFKM